jgi:AcrR family transcriptional regulator
MFRVNLHQLRSQQTRQRLLEAAVELIAKRGDGDLSLHEVARQAGMTTGAVQHHFASKAALRAEVLSRLVQSLGEATDLRADPRWPVERRAEHFVHEAWRQVFGHPRFCVAWGAFLAARPHRAARAHLGEVLAPIMVRMNDELLAAFPELASRPGGLVHAQLALAALRGMGLASPFSPPGSFDAALALLTGYVVDACRESERPAAPPPKRQAAGHKGSRSGVATSSRASSSRR